MLLEFIGLLIVFGVAARLLYLKYDHWRYSHIPGPRRESFIYGNAAEFRKRLVAEGAWAPYWLDMVREHGIVFHSWLVMTPKVFVADPLVIKDMVTDSKTFLKIRQGRGFIGRRISFNIQRVGTTRACGFNSLLTCDTGPIWRRKKKLMDPTFNIQRLTMHLPKFCTIASSMCDAIEAAQLECMGCPIDVTPLTGPFVIDGISTAGFNATEKQRIELRHSENGRNGERSKKILNKWGNIFTMVLDPEIRQFLYDYIESIKTIRRNGEEIIKERTSNGKYNRVGDILDCVISANMDESGEKLDLEECVDEFVAMYAASNSTTDTALLWGLGELTRNPTVMEKLVAEIDKIWVEAEIGGNTNPNFIGDTLKKMPYLDATVKEILRYHPPIQIISRTCSREINVCGYKIPPKANVVSSQYVMHHWEEHWTNPDKFEPERFLRSTPKPYTYIPFLLGPRQCIGKNFAIFELKVMLCELFKRFEIELDPAAPWKQRSSQNLVCFPIDNSYIFKSRI